MTANAFRSADDLLVQYAQYHRDRRNILTHFVGIPMIVLAVGILLARPVMTLGAMTVSLAWVAWAVSTLWYLSRGEFLLGLATSLINAVLISLAHPLAGGSVTAWLAWGLGAFVAGWIVQLLGHYYEGRKPAFVDDAVGLLVGPMFVAAEWLFAAGWRRDLLAEIERRAGPTMLRDLAQPLAR